MSRRGGVTPSARNTAALAAEAIDMEAKLMELRKAMELERAKREKAVEAGYWQSGGTGMLRSKYRGKPPASQQPAAEGPTLQPRLSSSSSQADGTQTPPLAPEGKAVAAGRRPAAGMLPAHRGSPSATSTTTLTTAASLPPAAATRRSSSGQVATGQQEARQQAGMRSHTPPTATAADSLAQGTFDEADSHQSFLEALNEWRAANRAGSKHAGTSDAAHSTGPQHTQHAPAGWGAATAASNSTSCSNAAGMQTETRSPSRPASASKPNTYFNRLVLNAASRQAGQAALPALPPDAAASSSTAGSMPGADSSSTGGLGLRLSIRTDLGSSSGALPANPALTLPSPSCRASSSTLPPLSSPITSTPQVYSLDAALASCAAQVPQAGAATASRHKGLDILEELERLELKAAAQQYDSDEEWAALLSPRHSGAPVGHRGLREDAPLVTTQQPGIGLTKGVRLPDAILLPETDTD